MKISDFISEMDKRYPKTLSADWDKDGLQCCADPDRELRRILVALDAGHAEIECACSGGYDMLLTHHPMLFGKVGDIVPTELYGARIIRLLSSGVACASFHTRLDAGQDGVNECLAKIMELQNVVSFGDAECSDIGRIGDLPSPQKADDLCYLIKEKLGAPYVRLSGSCTVRRLAVLGGAGKDCVMPAKMAGADAILTGEVSYNAVLDFAETGIAVIEAGHYYTEFPVCECLSRLAGDIAGAEVDIYAKATQKYF